MLAKRCHWGQTEQIGCRCLQPTQQNSPLSSAASRHGAASNDVDARSSCCRRRRRRHGHFGRRRQSSRGAAVFDGRRDAGPRRGRGARGWTRRPLTVRSILCTCTPLPAASSLPGRTRRPRVLLILYCTCTPLPPPAPPWPDAASHHCSLILHLYTTTAAAARSHSSCPSLNRKCSS